MPTAGAMAAVVLLLASVPSAAQEAPPVRVQVHVGGDPQLRARAATLLRSELQPLPNVTVSERDAEYVLSVVVLPIASTGFAVSAAVMNVQTDASLTALARLWGLDDTAAGRLRTMFKGNGALVDQRVLTGPDLAALCRDVVTAFAADTLDRARRAR